MYYDELPLATQMLLDPQLTLDAAVMEEWHAAVSAACQDGFLEDDIVLPPPAAQGGSSSTSNGARRGVKRLMDTHDFFTLADALDTLTGEVKASMGRDASMLPTQTSTTPHKSRTAARPQCGVDDFDKRLDPSSSAVQQRATREAHTAFADGQYKAALDVLLAASSTCMSHELTPPLLHNIAVCYYRLEQWDPCEAATQRVVSTDVARVYPSERRLVRVYVCQGRLEEAQRLVAQHRGSSDWHDEAAVVKAYSAYSSFYTTHQYARARESVEALLLLLPCGTLEAIKARLLSLDNAGAAAHYAQQTAAQYPHSAEAHMAAWELTFHVCTAAQELSALLSDMQRASVGTSDLRFRLLQSHITRSRDALQRLSALRRQKSWADVVAAASQTLQEPFVSDGVKGVLFYERAQARVQLATSWYDALDDAHRALSYTEAPELRAAMLLLVARCEEALGRFNDAVDHAEESLRLRPAPTTQTYMQKLHRRRTEEQQRAAASQTHKASASAASSPSGGQRGGRQQSEKGRSPPPPPPASVVSLTAHYETLALPTNADGTAVRKAYRAMAMKWHPDRWCGSTAVEIQVAETRFKAIQDAYEKLMQHLA